MRRVLGTLALACAVAGSAAPAFAQSKPCDSYSDACVEGTKHVKPEVRPSRDVAGLPFTGGEVVGLMVVGAGAVAGGTVLLAAGRKRRTA